MRANCVPGYSGQYRDWGHGLRGTTETSTWII